MWDRFISGYRGTDTKASDQKQIVLRYIALFHRFGFESPVAGEGEFIATLLQEDFPEITYARFQQIVEELKQQRILQGRTTLFIAPKLLHVHLWTQYWELHGRGRSISDLIRRIPDELMSWFVRMFSYAGESSVAATQVREVLAEDGPFERLEFALSDVGCRFLNELAGAVAGLTLKCLERIVAKASDDQLRRSSGRHQLVRALEKIAISPSLFCPSARLLLQLAAAEKTKNSGDAADTLVGLFCFAPGRAAPTAASPEIRFETLTELLRDANSRKIAVDACRTAMNYHSGYRVVGREFQGLKTAEMWTPETWGEVYDAQGKSWELLYHESRVWDVSSRGDANAAMIDSAVKLLRIPSLADRVLETLNELFIDDATDRQKLIGMVAKVRRFWKEEHDQTVLDRLNQLDVKLSGTEFGERLDRLVHFCTRHDLYDSDVKNVEKFNAQVIALAAEATRSEDNFRAALPGLIRGTNGTVFQFGRQFAKRDNGEWLNEILDAMRGEVNATCLFVSGYLANMFDSSPGEWERVITQLADDPSFRKSIGVIVRNSGVSESAVQLLRVLPASLPDAIFRPRYLGWFPF